MPNTIYRPHTPFTYFIRWSKLKMNYYGAKYAQGCHPDDLWTSYKTSSKPVKEFLKKHGDPDIIIVDKTFDTAKEAKDYESRFLASFDAAKNPNWLNRTNDNVNFYSTGPFSEEHRSKLKGPKSEEHRANMKKSWNLRGPVSDETRAKMSVAKLGKEPWNKGIPQSDETKAKISKSKVGSVVSQEQRSKLREANIRKGDCFQS